MDGTRSRRTWLPSPAMTVSLVALFVALSGTGYAVSLTVPNNSVGTPQLKNDAVTSKKVKNGTLVAADFKPGAAPVGPAGPAGPPGPAGATGPAGPPGTGTVVGFGASVSDAPVATSSATLLNVGSASVTVPAGSTATVVATFSAESLCNDGTSWCSVRLFIDGAEMNPEDGTGYAFDSPSASGSTWNDYEAHSVTRIRVGIPAGTHTVTVQMQAFGGNAFRLDDWSLTAVAYKTS